MKIDIVFIVVCVCVLAGRVAADGKAQQDPPNGDSATTVPSTSTTQIISTATTNATVATTISSSTSPTDSATTKSPEIVTIPSTTLAPLSTNSTDAPTTPNATIPTTASTDSSKTTVTTDLSTGENNPTAAPSKMGSGGFNALSFIGGIVFTVGLLAIMYVGFKFYKSRTERNYHTL